MTLHVSELFRNRTSFLLLISGLLVLSGQKLDAQTFRTLPALSFTKPFGGSDPLPQVVSVASAGANFNFAVASSTSTGGNWLTVSTGSSCGLCTTPEALTVKANPSVALAVGTYTGQITV